MESTSDFLISEEQTQRQRFNIDKLSDPETRKVCSSSIDKALTNDTPTNSVQNCSTKYKWHLQTLAKVHGKPHYLRKPEWLQAATTHSINQNLVASWSMPGSSRPCKEAQQGTYTIIAYASICSRAAHSTGQESWCAPYRNRTGSSSDCEQRNNDNAEALSSQPSSTTSNGWFNSFPHHPGPNG